MGLDIAIAGVEGDRDALLILCIVSLNLGGGGGLSLLTLPLLRWNLIHFAISSALENTPADGPISVRKLK